MITVTRSVPQPTIRTTEPLLFIDDVRDWIEQRMPGVKRSRQWVRNHVPVELRVHIGRGMFFYESDIAEWFTRNAKPLRDK